MCQVVLTPAQGGTHEVSFGISDAGPGLVLGAARRSAADAGSVLRRLGTGVQSHLSRWPWHVLKPMRLAQELVQLIGVLPLQQSRSALLQQCE